MRPSYAGWTPTGRMVKSVKPYLRCPVEADFSSDSADMYNVPDFIKIKLTGQSFELSEAACRKIPLIRAVLEKHYGLLGERILETSTSSTPPSTSTSQQSNRFDTKNTTTEMERDSTPSRKDSSRSCDPTDVEFAERTCPTLKVPETEKATGSSYRLVKPTQSAWAEHSAEETSSARPVWRRNAENVEEKTEDEESRNDLEKGRSQDTKYISQFAPKRRPVEASPATTHLNKYPSHSFDHHGADRGESKLSTPHRYYKSFTSPGQCPAFSENRHTKSAPDLKRPSHDLGQQVHFSLDEHQFRPKKTRRSSGVSITYSQISEPKIVLNFERDPRCFASIVSYVHNGELHMPAHLCPTLFVNELNYWGIDLDLLQPCCFPSLVRFLDEQEKINAFHMSHDQLYPSAFSEDCSGAWSKIRSAVWKVLDCPGSSRLAKAYFTVFCAAVVASFFAVAAGTHDYFRRPLTDAEWREYLGGDIDKYKELQQNSSSHPGRQQNESFTEFSTRYPNTSSEVRWVRYLSYASTGFLTLDFLLRLIFVPTIRQFILDPVNWTDGLALTATFVKMVIDQLLPNENYNQEAESNVIDMLQLLRVLRFLRPMSKVRGFRVVYFALKYSLMELVLMFTTTFFLVFVFASVLYYFGDESMPSIPHAMWYSLVTITTVGYGDIVPREFRTKVIGGMCAMCGVVLLSLTMPVIVSNFLMLYVHSNIKPTSCGRNRNSI